MLENYVKFLRGTPSAYEKLANKNVDTLYFISEPEAATGMLYLGSKLIAGGISSDLTLSDLKGITLSEDIAAGQILVYDSEKGWVNANLEEAIGIFQGAGTDPDHAGLPGLVPAPAVGQTNAYLRSDGTWATIEFSQNITTKVNGDGVAHTTLLAEIENPALDDIVIIRDIIFAAEDEANNKYQHTAYIYNGEAWAALDGNYSADNIYFDNEEFVFTESVGTVRVDPSVGNATFNIKGLSLKQALSKLFANEEEPLPTKPTFTVTLNPTTTSYEVGTKITQGFKTTFSAGSYTYGPDTGIIKVSHIITDSEGNTVTDNSKFPEQLVTNDFDYYLIGSADHTEGAIPVTNLGNPCEAKKIAAGTVTSAATSHITGFRYAFFGSVTEKKETLTSDDIRSLAGKKKSSLLSSEFDVTVKNGTSRVIIAYPASLSDLKAVKDVNDANTNIVSSFGTPITVKVAGVDGYDPIDYKVYIQDGSGFTADNIYKVTLK